MPSFITDQCTACGACERDCPVEAIAPGEKRYTVDPVKCIECGTCAEVCPSDAVVLHSSATQRASGEPSAAASA